MSIDRINNIGTNNIARFDGIATTDIDKIDLIDFPSGSTGVFTTDKLLIWYDAALESSGATTLTNRVTSSLSNAIVQTGHDAGRPNNTSGSQNASVVAIDGTQAMYTDGVNDGFWKRAYFTPFVGSGGNHGTSTFGVANKNMVTNPATNSVQNTGFTIEVWWRTNGSFTNNGNLWSFYHNGGIRTRWSSSGVRWFYMQGTGVMSSGWGTYNTNVWYHDVTTLSAPNTDGSSSGRHTLKLYNNGSLVQSLTNRTWNPATWVRDLILFGGSRSRSGGVDEDFRGYYGIVRVYHKPLTSTEITTNFNAEKGRYGY
jgi:hypothetical protein